MITDNKTPTTPKTVKDGESEVPRVRGVANPFGRSAKIRRSPPNSSRIAVEKLDDTPKNSQESIVETSDRNCVGSVQPPKNTLLEDTPQYTKMNSDSRQLSSPRQEFILKMKNSEEEALDQCQRTIRKIRQAMSRQRNINMDVQNGISELEELFDVIKQYRKNWKTAEKEKQTDRVPIGNERTTLAEKEKLSEKNAQTANDQQKEIPPAQKRIAASPAEKPTPGKKRKNISRESKTQTDGRSSKDGERNSTDSQVKPVIKRKFRRRLPKQRPEAVFVRPAVGQNYADVLKRLKDEVRPEDSDITVRSIRKTKTGAILVEVAKGGKVEKFSQAIKDSLKETAEVKDLRPRLTVEIRDIDCTSTKEDVVAAVCKLSDMVEGDIIVRLTNLNPRDQRRAFVVLPINGAKKLLSTGRIKIGWTNCRVQYREEEKRCFKCFGLGHEQRNCRGLDRKSRGVCIQCGEEGHFMRQCRNPTNCCLCREQGKSPTDHLPGSKSCKAERQI